MAKKKATEKETAPQATRPPKKVTARPTALASAGAKSASKQAAGAESTYVFRHEIDGHPDNTPLIVDIPIMAGRGENPARPSYVGFTAEMAEEEWPDQFSFRVVALDGRRVRVMISRVDKGAQELGWGVKLIVHVLVVAPAK